MYSYKYKDGYLIYNRNSNKIFFTHSIDRKIESKYNNIYGNNINNNTNFIHKEDLKEVQITYISTPFCNLYCKYCYEHNKIPNYKLSPMSAEQHYNIYKAIQDYYPQANIKICFFGGEPLLAKNSIKKFIEMLKLNCTKHNDKFPSLYMITNGTLLDEDTRKFIYNYFNSITFSLDGTKVLNDSNRLYKDGKGCFDDIVININELNKLNSNKRLTTACEVTLTDAYFKNYSYTLIKDVWNLLKELKFDQVEFSIVLDHNATLINKPDNLDVIAKDLVDLWYDDILNNTSIIKIPSLISNLSLLIGRKTNENIICAAGHSYFAIDSNYNIYPCQISIFDNSNAIGKIINSNIVFNVKQPNSYPDKSNCTLCSKCECLKSCVSYCKVVMNNFNNNISPGCIFNKKLFKYSLLKIVEIMNSNQKNRFVDAVKRLFS